VIEPGEVLAAEELAHHTHGKEKAVTTGCSPAIAATAEAARTHDAVDVHVLTQVLAPSVEHHRDRGLGSQMPWIAGQLAQRC